MTLQVCKGKVSSTFYYATFSKTQLKGELCLKLDKQRKTSKILKESNLLFFCVKIGKEDRLIVFEYEIKL